jgi:hypothetical protein
MDRPTIENTNAVQAGTTIGTYLGVSIAEIDKRLGEGYAEKHPALVSETTTECSVLVMPVHCHRRK